MLVEIAVVVAASAAMYAIQAAVNWFVERNAFNNYSDEDRQKEAEQRADESLLTETDKKMAEATRECIQRVFGEPAVETIMGLEGERREERSTELIGELCRLYNIELKEIRYESGHASSMGGYSYRDGVLHLNTKYLMCNNPACIREYIDTIVHELRHAVQWSAATKGNDVWNVPEDVQRRWNENFLNYISPAQDFKGYCEQLVESDAFTFAHFATKGVR